MPILIRREPQNIQFIILFFWVSITYYFTIVALRMLNNVFLRNFLSHYSFLALSCLGCCCGDRRPTQTWWGPSFWWWIRPLQIPLQKMQRWTEPCSPYSLSLRTLTSSRVSIFLRSNAIMKSENFIKKQGLEQCKKNYKDNEYLIKLQNH